jgi:hypothetical protein
VFSATPACRFGADFGYLMRLSGRFGYAKWINTRNRNANQRNQNGISRPLAQPIFPAILVAVRTSPMH